MEEVDLRVHPIMEINMMVKERSLFVTNVEILEILKGIVEHLKVRMGKIRGEIHLYVNYAINLDP